MATFYNLLPLLNRIHPNLCIFHNIRTRFFWHELHTLTLSTLNALKLQYNQLGKRVTEGRDELERALSLSRKAKKELVAQGEWCSTREAELARKLEEDGEGTPQSLNQEVDWCKVSSVFILIEIAFHCQF